MYGSQSIAGCRANIKCKKKRLFSEQYLLLRVIVEHFFIYLFCFLVLVKHSFTDKIYFMRKMKGNGRN